MPALRRSLFAALACLTISVSTLASGQSDQAIAERVLGRQWKQLSRRAGMVFAGTVLSARPQIGRTGPSGTDQTTADPVRTDRPVPAVELSFRVDRAIAGVEPGQVLTIHEWTGAWPLHHAMRPGEHILIFLYPPSRLGFTSPVGGTLGQIALDASGTKVVVRAPLVPSALGSESSPLSPPAQLPNISVSQLERAIRAARGE
jgi:hypothetical protein